MPGFPRASTELAIDEIREPQELEGMASEWRELWERRPQLHCFQRPEWLLPWVRHFFRGEKIWAFAFRSNGHLAGLAPLFIHRHHRNPEVRQVSFIGAGITDYLDLLCEPQIAEQATSMMFQHLLDHRERWDVCDLQELPGASPILAAHLPAGLSHAWLPCGICPVMPLPASAAEFDESLRGRFKNLRRTMHQLARDPAVEITAADPATYRDHLLDLFRLHRERWKERRESGHLAVLPRCFLDLAGLGIARHPRAVLLE